MSMSTLPLALRSPKVAKYGFFALHQNLRPLIRIKRSGNGWRIVECYTDEVGVVVPYGAEWAVFACGHSALISRLHVPEPRDAAWLLVAYLEADGARRRDDPVHHPIPGNADVLDEVWDRAVGAGHQSIPTWAEGSDGRRVWTSDEFGALELVECAPCRWSIRREMDGRWLTDTDQRKCSLAGTVTAAAFESHTEAMQAVLGTETGWTAYKWRHPGKRKVRERSFEEVLDRLLRGTPDVVRPFHSFGRYNHE